MQHVVKAVAYVMDLHGKQSEETNWVSLFIDKDRVMYIDYFELEISLKIFR